MSSTLESVDWGKRALQLLQQVHNLDPNTPAIMHIRHSERHTLEENTPYGMALTETGVQTSIEFGGKLPTNRRYNIFSTRIQRSIDTAELIHKGIQENGGYSRDDGVIKVTSIRDSTVHQRNMIKLHEGRSSEEAIRYFVYRWVSGHYPESVIKPSLEFTQQAARVMMQSIKEAEPEDVVIWVSHDNWIAPFLLHWLGVYDWGHIQFLDGFILQFYEDHMMLFFRDEKTKVSYPHWWNME